MLISKTVCPAGSLLYIVPTGLQVTLHYDALGNLTNVYQGFNSKEDLGKEFMQALLKHKLVPAGIKLRGGITDVWGVFYSNVVTSPMGHLPECEYDRIKNDILSGEEYKFYVGYVTSGAAAISNPTAMLGWAKSVKLDILPSWLAPANISDATLKTFIHSIPYPFEFPFIAGYIIKESVGDPYYSSVDLFTGTINKCKKFVNESGYINYEVNVGDANTYTLPYPNAAVLNLQKDTQILIDRSDIIWSSTHTSNHKDRLPFRITCEHCGKIIDVPESGGLLTCSDPSCTSLLYPRIKQLCAKLDIITPTFAKFKKSVKSKDIQVLPDIFLLPEYEDLEIQVPIWKVLSGFIPEELGVSDDWIARFCNKCNNEYKTISYYLNGPRRITTELDIVVSPRLMRWLADPQVLLELDTIMQSKQIKIIDEDKLAKFDAPPRLHDKTIFITGTFKHGSLRDIATILQSYNAVVVTEYDDFINYVLVGDIKDNIDGKAILGARALNIPIVDESAFFAHYRIDEDLANNLV